MSSVACLRSIARSATAIVVLVAASSGCRACNGDATTKRTPDADADADAGAAASSELPDKDAAATEVDSDPDDPTPNEARTKAHVPALVYAAFTRDETTVVGSRGVAKDAVFEAASIAKTVVATAVMQLVTDGKLDLDTDVSRYVGFAVRHPTDKAAITLRLLLTHRASVIDRLEELNETRRDATLGDFVERYFVEKGGPRAGTFLDNAPGTFTRYSNAGVALAAFAVEKVAGETFDRFTRARIFEPLGMKHASWVPPNVRFVRPHRWVPNKDGNAALPGDLVPLPPASHAVYPVVDLFATADDLARFARAILREGELDGNRILPPAAVREMLRAQSAKDASKERAGDQALAWQLRSIGGRAVVGHEGEDAGASTGLFLDVSAGVGAVVLANGDAFISGDHARAAALEDLVAHLLSRATQPRPSGNPVGPISSADAH